MMIECLVRRDGPTPVHIGNIKYLFMPYRPKGEKGLFKEAMTAAKGSYTKVQGIADSSSYASKRHEIVSDIIVPAVRKL